MASLNFDQFIDFVTGSVCDQLECYDCDQTTYHLIRCMVSVRFVRSGMDHNKIDEKRYYDWFFPLCKDVKEAVLDDDQPLEQGS